MVETHGQQERPTHLPTDSFDNRQGNDAPSIAVILNAPGSGVSPVVFDGALFGSSDRANLGDGDSPVPRSLTLSAVDTVGRRLEALLADLGGAWYEPPLEQLEPWHLEPHRPSLRQAIVEQIERCEPNETPYLADPRLCLVAGQLRSLLPVETRYILVVRHPLEAAFELYEHSSTPVTHGLALWEAYTSAALRGLSGDPLHVVEYSTLSAQSSSGTDLVPMLKLLRSGHPYVIPDGSPMPTDEGNGEASTWLTVSQQELWALMRKSASRPQPTVLPGEPASRAVRETISHRSRLTRLAASDQIRDAELDSLSRELAKVTSHYGELLEGVRSLEVERDQAKSRRAAAEEARATAARQVDAMQTQVAEAHVREATLTAELARLAADADDLQNRLAETLTGATDLRREVLQARAVQAELVQRLAHSEAAQLESQGQIEAFLGSAEAAPSLAHSGLSFEDACILMQEVDSARAELRQLGAVRERHHGNDSRSLVDWVADCASGLESARAVEGRLVGEIDAVNSHRNRLMHDISLVNSQRDELARSLELVNSHRDQLVHDVNAICASESWRLGHTLTWPARYVRRLARTSRAKDRNIG